MKYLKLYEDFNNQDEILSDIETILDQLLHDSNSSNRYSKRLGCELDGDLIFYELDTECSEEDLKVAKLRLNDLNYKIVYFEKNYCWIVNIDILSDEFKDSDEIIFIKSGQSASLKNLKINNDFKKLRRYLLFKYWEKTPILSHDILKLFLNKTDLAYGDDVFLSTFFIEFLGIDRIKNILNDILTKDKYYSISEEAGIYGHTSEYKFDFKIEDFSIPDIKIYGEQNRRLSVTCFVDYESATITTNGNELNVLDIFENTDDTGVINNIDNGIIDCIAEFLYGDIKIWEKTGLSVDVEISNIN